MMGLLDDILAQQGPGGPFNGAYPATPKTFIDYSSGWPIEMEVPKPQFGPIPAPAKPADMPAAAAIPFGFAGPGFSTSLDPATLTNGKEPARPAVAATAPATPTDVSAASRAVGAPLSLAPPVPSQPVQAPAPTSTAPPEKGFFENLRGKVNDNSNMLLAFAGGLAGGRSWGDGLSKGLQMAVPAGQLDTAARQKQITQTATYSALKARGVSDADAMLAMQNPEALKSLLSRLWPTFKSANVGNTTGSFNEATGEFKPGFTDTKYEKVGAGDTLFATPGGVPGAGGVSGKPVAVASGGPQQPPSGYEWIDPSDPSKGQRGIEGGPADKIPAEVAARLGLAKSFLGQLPEIRKRIANGELTGPIDGIQGALNMGGPGEIRRQISSGSEALLRNLTGAGMSLPEAEKYVKRYEVETTDSANTVLSKLNQLERELRSVDQIVSKGRSGGVLSSAPSASDPMGLR